MTLVFGSCVEPGGMELDNDRNEVECPVCTGKAIARTWEACEGGAVNVYSNIHCTECNYFEGDTGEGDDYDYLFDDYDHLFDDELLADIQALFAEDQADTDAASALASPAWLTKADFLTFAAGVRQAA